MRKLSCWRTSVLFGIKAISHIIYVNNIGLRINPNKVLDTVREIFQNLSVFEEKAILANSGANLKKIENKVRYFSILVLR